MAAGQNNTNILVDPNNGNALVILVFDADTNTYEFKNLDGTDFVGDVTQLEVHCCDEVNAINIYEDSSDLTGDRVLTGLGNSLTFIDISTLIFGSTSTTLIESEDTGVQREAGIVLNGTSGQILVEAKDNAGSNDSGILLDQAGGITFQYTASGTPSSYLFPLTDGTPNQVLSTDGLGILSWVSPLDVNTNIYNTDDSLTGARTVTGAGFPLTFTGLTTYANTSTVSTSINSTDGVNTDSLITLNGATGATHIEAAETVLNNSSAITLQHTTGITFEYDILGVSDNYTFPIGDGTLNQVLTTNGLGILSWQDAPGAGGPENIYTDDGTILDDRVVTIGSMNLLFDGDSGTIEFSDTNSQLELSYDGAGTHYTAQRFSDTLYEAGYFHLILYGLEGNKITVDSNDIDIHIDDTLGSTLQQILLDKGAETITITNVDDALSDTYTKTIWNVDNIVQEVQLDAAPDVLSTLTQTHERLSWDSNLSLTGEETHALITGDNNDITFTSAGQVSKINFTTAFTDSVITGVDASDFEGGSIVIFFNDSVEDITITHADAGSGANNRFNLPGDDFTFGSGETVIFRYTTLGGKNRWEPLGGTSDFNTVTGGGGNTGSYTVALEVNSNTTANLYEILPVDCSAGTVTIDPPAGATKGDWFSVVDSRKSSATNNITIDFITAGYNYYADAAANAIFATNEIHLKFIYVDATVGWVSDVS